jgi:hypothetical protein
MSLSALLPSAHDLHAPTTWPQHTLIPRTPIMLKFTLDRAHHQGYPVLFTLAVSSSAAQLALTTYLIVADSRMDEWRRASYHSLFVVSRLFFLVPSIRPTLL